MKQDNTWLSDKINDNEKTIKYKAIVIMIWGWGY